MRKLRLQLIAILILAVLLPPIPVAVTTHALIRRGFDPLLEGGIEDGTRAGIEIMREVLDGEKRRFLESIARGDAVDTLTAERLRLLDPRERSALEAWSRTARRGEISEQGVEIRIPPERMPIVGRQILIASVARAGGDPVWVTRPLPADLVSRAERLTESIRLLETLRRERATVVRGLVATFLAVYCVVVVLVLLLGLLLASRITRPLTSLGHGIDRVASGDLGTVVAETSRGAIGKLLRNFNEMVGRLRSQQEELVRLEKLAAWRQMARRLAHEIKNPLTPIQLAAQQIRAEQAGADPSYRHLVEEATAIIEEEVRRLRTLVSDFSQFARMPRPQCSELLLADLLDGVGELYGTGKVVVRTDGVDRDLRLWCDEDQIHRVLINLVDNALAAQETSGRATPVEISAACDPDERIVRIRVSDRGPGVPDSERRRIFEPDFTTKPDGMGLGLAIVENTIQGHGGSIEVSGREGGGAVFTLSLPARPRPVEGESV